MGLAATIGAVSEGVSRVSPILRATPGVGSYTA